VSASDWIFTLGLLTVMLMVWNLIVQSGGGANGDDED
jgi:hypothetical protein